MASERPLQWLRRRTPTAPAQTDTVACATPGLHCAHVALTLGSRTLFSNLSVTFQPGRITALLGPNGAGKSSLLSLLAGLRSPDAGTVRLDDQALMAAAAPELARRRAVMPQESQVAFDFTAAEVVEMGRYPHRLQPAADEMHIVDQALVSMEAATHGTRLLATLSGGEKARIQLARALAQVWHAPPCGRGRWLLLDEPTAAMDLAHQHRCFKRLLDWAHQQGVGVVVVMHDLNLALRYADDALILSPTQPPVFGAVREVLSPSLVSEHWGVRCEQVMASSVPQLLFSD